MTPDDNDGWVSVTQPVTPPPAAAKAPAADDGWVSVSPPAPKPSSNPADLDKAQATLTDIAGGGDGGKLNRDTGVLNSPNDGSGAPSDNPNFWERHGIAKPGSDVARYGVLGTIERIPGQIYDRWKNGPDIGQQIQDLHAQQGKILDKYGIDTGGDQSKISQYSYAAGAGAFGTVQDPDVQAKLRAISPEDKKALNDLSMSNPLLWSFAPGEGIYRGRYGPTIRMTPKDMPPRDVTPEPPENLPGSGPNGTQRAEPPKPGADIGLKFPDAPSKRATIVGYFDDGKSVRVQFEDGTFGDYHTDDLTRDLTQPPPEKPQPPGAEPAAPVKGETQSEEDFFKRMDEMGATPGSETRPAPRAPLIDEATNALDHADRLEAGALNPRSSLSTDTRQAMLMQAAKLRQQFGVPRDNSVTLSPEAEAATEDARQAWALGRLGRAGILGERQQPRPAAPQAQPGAVPAPADEAPPPMETAPEGPPAPPHAYNAPAPQLSQAPGTDFINIDPRDLTVDADKFQYKSGGNEKGVVGNLTGSNRWEPALANPITTWLGNDGRLYVVNGHQRTDLALRAIDAGQPNVTIPARVYKESDGYTPADMKALGAYQNIAEGSGTALDAARIMRETGLTPNLLDLPSLPPKAPLVQEAQALSRLSDDAFKAVENGVVPSNYAAEVAKTFPDPEQQMAAINTLAKADPPNVAQARMIVQDMKEAGWNRNLDRAQGSMFGDEDIEALYPNRARILDNAQKILRRTRAVFKTAVDQEGTLEGAGNKMSREANLEGKSENEKLAATLASEGLRRGPISDALSESARALANGQTLARATSDFLAQARKIGPGKTRTPVEPSNDLGGAGHEVPQQEERDDLTGALFEPDSSRLKPTGDDAKPFYGLTEEIGRRYDGQPLESVLPKAADWVVKMGGKTGFEFLLAWDVNGSKVISAGTSKAPRHVTFSADLKDRLMSDGGNIVLSHNHPSGTALSEPDLLVFVAPSVTWQFANGHDGHVTAARLTPEAAKRLKSPIPTITRIRTNQLEKIVDFAVDNLANILQTATNSRAIKSDVGNKLFRDILNHALDAAGLLEYVSSRPLTGIPESVILHAVRSTARATIEAAYARGLHIGDLKNVDDYRPAIAPSPQAGIARVLERIRQRPVSGLPTGANGNPAGQEGAQAAGAKPPAGRLTPQVAPDYSGPKFSPQTGQGRLFEPGGLSEGDRTALQQHVNDLAKTQAFKEWFGDSKVVNPDGTPKIVYRGDYRDIGDTLKKKASEAARFYFTENPEVASNYSTGKPYYDDRYNDFADWFSFPPPPGQRKPLNLTRLWHYLTPEQQASLKDTLLRARHSDDGEMMFDGPADGGITSRDHWNYELRNHHNNWLEAAKEIWLTSGAMFNEERQFMQILEHAGIKNGTFDDPREPHSAVTPVVLSLQNPLDTRSINGTFIRQLGKEIKTLRGRARSTGMFNKDSITPQEWFSELERDYMDQSGRDPFAAADLSASGAWTAIPEKITEALQRMGYDGIDDQGGKMGGEKHGVYIAFEPHQVKSVFNRGTFSSDTGNMLREPPPAIDKIPEGDQYVIPGAERRNEIWQTPHDQWAADTKATATKIRNGIYRVIAEGQSPANYRASTPADATRAFHTQQVYQAAAQGKPVPKDIMDATREAEPPQQVSDAEARPQTTDDLPLFGPKQTSLFEPEDEYLNRGAAPNNPEAPEIRNPGEGHNGPMDDIADQLAQSMRGRLGATDRLLDQLDARSGAYKELGSLEQYWIMPRTLARLDERSARLWDVWRRHDEGVQRMDHKRAEQSRSYLKLDDKQRAALHAAEELDRLNGITRKDDGRRLVVANDKTPQAELSKPGQRFTLDADTTKAYFDRRAMFADIWKDLMAGTAKKLGWDGAPDPKIIREAADRTQNGAERKSLLNVADILQAMGEQKRTGYVPLMRYGDYYIAVRDRTPKSGLGGFPPTVRFELVDSQPPGSSIVGKIRPLGYLSPKIRQRLDELGKQYPASTHMIEHGPLYAKADSLKKMDIPAIEKLMVLLGSDIRKRMSAAAAQGDISKAEARKQVDIFKEMIQYVRDAMYEEMKAGFKKKSNTVPGYSTDFKRATGSYLAWTTRHIADLTHGDEMRSVFDNDIERHPNKAVRKFWKNWVEYQDRDPNTLERISNGLRQAAFMWVMAANPASAAVVLSHGPLFAHASLAASHGVTGSGKMLYGAMNEAKNAITASADKGLHIDVDKLGRTPGEKAMLKGLLSEGRLHHSATSELMGLKQPMEDTLGLYKNQWHKAQEIAGSTVGVMDQLNRSAVALAAYRMARAPGGMEKFMQAWGDNEVLKRMIAKDGETPETMARFMVDEGLFVWGERNRSWLQRLSGVGTMLFQFKNFVTNAFSTMVKFMRRMGNPGRKAAMFLLGSLLMIGGVTALPFAKDAENALDSGYKIATGIDPDISTKLQDFMLDSGLGKWVSDTVLHGLPYSTLGVDLSQRLGFGEEVNRTIQGLGTWGAAPGIFMRAAKEGLQAITSDDTWRHVANAVPSAVGHLINAFKVMPEEGLKSASGKTVIPADKLTAADKFWTALGFTPSHVSEARDVNAHNARMVANYKERLGATYDRLVRLNSQIMQARRSGDVDRANGLTKQFSKVVQDSGMKINPISLRQRMQSDLEPTAAQIKRAPKAVRPDLRSQPQ